MTDSSIRSCALRGRRVGTPEVGRRPCRMGLAVVGLVAAFGAFDLTLGDESGRAAERRPDKVDQPILEGPKAWRSPVGEWQVVGGVRVDSKNERRLSAQKGTGVMLNGPRGRTRNLLTREEYGDVRVHIEFVVPRGSNSGIYFMGRYEIQVLDSWGVKVPGHGDCGGIYQRWDPRRGKGKEGFGGRPPRVNAARRPGEWQEFDVVFKAPRFDADGKKIANASFVKVVHNGTVIHENQEVTGPTRAASFGDERPFGPIMLQGDHGPVAYRNLRIEKVTKE